jgi:hypothetical protein
MEMWNPNKIYRYSGCAILPEGNYIHNALHNNVQHVSETARCPDLPSAHAWAAGWLGKTIERQS